MIRHAAFFTVVGTFVVGCGASEPPRPTAATAPAPTAPTTDAPKEAPKATAEKPKVPEGPPLAVSKLEASLSGKTLNVSWDVTRNGDVPAGTVLFIHSACKVGYTTKSEDESVSGVDVIPAGSARSFKVPAFASVGLPFEPTWCTFNFGYGPKGTSSETKLSSFCWKKGAVTEGACS